MDVCRSGSLGLAIAGSATNELARNRQADILNEVLLSLFGKPSISPDAFDESLAVLKTKLDKYGIDLHKTMITSPATLKHRVVKSDYPVSSVLQTFIAMFYVVVVSALVQAGVVEPFLCEEDLLPPDPRLGMPVVDVKKVHARYITAATKGRQLATMVIDAARVDSGSQIIVVLKKKSDELYQMDPRFAIITELFNDHVGEKGAARLKARILGLMPTEATPLDAKTVLVQLIKMKESKFRTFCGVGVGSVLEDVEGWVENIAMNKPPAFHGEFTSDFTRKVRDGLALYYDVENRASSASGASQRLVCQRAAKFEYDKYADLVQKSDPSRTPDMLTKLQVFSWLLKPNERIELHKWSEQFLAKGSEAVKKRKGASVGKPSLELSAQAKIAKLFRNN